MRTADRAVALAGALILGAFLAATTTVVLSAERGDQNQAKPDKAVLQQAQALIKLVDAVAAGQPAPADIPFTFTHHALKAQDGKTFVPFLLAFEPGKLPSPQVSLYLRVVRKGGDTPPATPPAGEKPDNKKTAAPLYAFEDLYNGEVKAEPSGGSMLRLARSFAVTGGEYDVYLAVRDRGTPVAKDAQPPTTVMKQTVTVPDLWTAGLATSSLFLAESAEPLPTPPTPQQIAQYPYILGQTRVVPSLDHELTKAQELLAFMVVYNTGLDQANKPDITVEYSFYRTVDGAEKYFNKTEPQVFNAQTLGQFDATAGHQIVAGQGIPLSVFPEGTYRLEMKATDKIANKTVAKSVNFTISAG